jgi:hypothetical protein
MKIKNINMLDYYTVVLKGWKISGSSKVSKVEEELELIDEDYIDTLESCIVTDSMCGKYLYFGVIISRYDSEEENEVIITDKLIEKATEKYNKLMSSHPDLELVLEKYKSQQSPQLYVFQNIW